MRMKSFFSTSNHFLIGIILFVSCENKDISPKDPAPSLQYLVFGHLDGFCIQCDVLYKIEDGQLYTTRYQQQIDPANPQFFGLGTSQYDSAQHLIAEVPEALLKEKAQTLGTYFPDVGHYYIEIKSNGVIQHWYIEGNGVPHYLKTFLADMNATVAILR